MQAAQKPLFVGKKTNHLYFVREWVPELNQPRVTVYWGGQVFVSFLGRDQRPLRNAMVVALVQAGLKQKGVAEVFNLRPAQASRYVKLGASVVEGTPGRPIRADDRVCAFVRQEYSRIRGEGRGRWREEVRQMVREKYGVDLKLPTLSAIVAEQSRELSSSRKGTDASPRRRLPYSVPLVTLRISLIVVIPWAALCRPS